MILKRLFELAEREQLMAELAFELQPVPYIVKLGPAGEYLGIEERRGMIAPPSKGKRPAKPKPDKGKELSIPRPHGAATNPGFARYFVDSLPRVLPISDEKKSVASRATFWQQIHDAAADSHDEALAAVAAFGRQLEVEPQLAERLRRDLEQHKTGPSDRCTFAWDPDAGRTILERDTIRHWYRRFFTNLSSEKQEAGPIGLCQVTGKVGPLPKSHPQKLSGIPNGLATGVSLVSYDKDAFESYGLDRAANAGVGHYAADAYLRALTALIGNRLKGNPKTSLKVANVLFLFWTREPSDTDDLMQLDQPTPEEVARLMESAERGRAPTATDVNQFYCLGLSGNAARAIVRDYLEAPLPDVRINLGRWFRDLRIADATIDGQGQPTSLFPLWQLASATARDSDDVSPELPPQLLEAALRGDPLPDSVLAACLRRLRAEHGPQQFRPARMGLVKLCLNRFHFQGDSAMTEELDPNRTADRAYVCGRLLAFLARCQSPKDFGTSAQILERYFGAASTSPRSVFPTLLRLNRHHIAKIRDEMTGFAFNLEAELESLLLPLREGTETPDFPAILSLPEQGRFALGFYHQRADYRRASADRKIREAEEVAAQ
jgi:CRISPR-associated protein Csd1